MKKSILMAMVAVLALTLTAYAADDKKAPFDKEGCCAKAHVKAEVCSHPCCLEAAKTNKVCKKCNKENGDKEVYTKDSCCAKAAAEGKACSHPCCATSNKAGNICAKCNKPAEKK